MGKLDLSKNKLVILLVLALLSLVLAVLNVGFGVGFWIILVLWLIIYLIFFVKPVVQVFNIFLVVVVFSFVLSLLISYKVILNSSDNNSQGTTVNGIVLSKCSSQASDTPKMVEGWKSTIYAAPLESSSPDISRANNVRTFSYSGINNDTEKNSVYSRVEKVDESFMTGYGTTMEVCDENNMATKSYVTTSTTYTAGSNTVATTSYLHGGNYLHGAGNYRIDVYLKTTDGV